MENVKIVANKKSGKLVTPYQMHPERGFIVLRQERLYVSGRNLNESKRSTVISGLISLLQKMVTKYPGGVCPGNLVIKEFVMSDNSPEFQALQRQYFNMSLGVDPNADASLQVAQALQANMEAFTKRTGNDGIPMTIGGEPIIRFVIYDEKGEQQDTRLQHDNVADVKEYFQSKRAEASLVVPEATTKTEVALEVDNLPKPATKVVVKK